MAGVRPTARRADRRPQRPALPDPKGHIWRLKPDVHGWGGSKVNTRLTDPDLFETLIRFIVNVEWKWDLLPLAEATQS